MRIWLLMGALALAGVAQDTMLPAGTIVHRDLSYVTNGHERQKLDLYLPKGRRNMPLIILVHGGAWRAGKKEDEPVAAFVAAGYAAASINYRLSSDAIFPAQIQDCKAAVRYLRANAAKYFYDASRFGAIGSSAGGHLVALMGLADGVKDFETPEYQTVTSDLQAVVDLFGPTDFLLMDGQRLPGATLVHSAPDSPESQLVGGPILQNKAKVKRANPITYVNRSAPPFLLIHGDSDLLVPHHQSELLESALQSAGVPVKLMTITGGVHGRPTYQAGLPAALEFFGKILHHTPPE